MSPQVHGPSSHRLGVRVGAVDHEPELTALVADDWRELLPTAFLLAGDDAGARELLVRGLARGDGVDGVVRAHLRRRFGRDGELVTTSAAPWWVSPADAEAAAQLSTTLADLSRAERAAVVLRWFEQLPQAEVAARVPGVDLSALPDRLGIPAAELPTRLEQLAATAQVADLDDEAVAGGVRAVRARRRRVLLGVTAVAALAVGVSWLPRPVPTPVPTPAATATSAPPSLVGGPARGSLAEDRELVSALLARLDPAPEDSRLVYAGDGVGHRWVLLVARGPDRTDAHWFTGPRGTAPDDLAETSVGYDGALPPAWSIAVTDETGTTVIVVARDRDAVEISSGVDVAPDGRATRRFTPNAGLDGVVTVPVDRPSGTGIEYHVLRAGSVVGTGSPVVAVDGPVLPPRTEGPRSGTGPVDPTAAAIATQAITGPTGRVVSDLELVVLGAGSFPAPGGRRAQAVTVAATLPGGAVVTSTAWATQDGVGQVCGTEVHPAGTAVSTLTVVTRCSTGTSSSPTTVVVVAPPGAQVALGAGAGRESVQPGLVGGWTTLVDDGDDLAVFTVAGQSGQVSRAGDGPLDHA